VPQSLPRARSRAVATLALLATTLMASTALAPQALADLPPVQPGTTIWTADGTTASTSGEHDGSSENPMYAAGASGAADDQSFDFNGNNDWAPITMDSDVAQFGRAPFAVSFRMRTDRSHQMSLLGARNVCGNDAIGWFDVRVINQRIGFEVGGDRYAAVMSPVLVANGQWHTVDLRRDGTGISVTVDGQTARVNTSPSAVNPTAPFGVNNSPCKYRDGTRPFLGQVDDIRVGPLDITAPTLTPLADQRLEATGPAGAKATYTAEATDDVDGAVTPACTPASGSTFALGSTDVTCVATDATGNSSAESFTVTVVDTTAPTLSLPAAFSVDASGPSGGVVTYAASAADAVSGAIAPACTPASGSSFAVGTTSVTCTATDAAGNNATGSFTVTVSGATAQAAALVTTLEGWSSGCAVQASQAQTSLERGKLTAARGQLGATGNCTSAAIKAGRLTTAQGDAVTEAIARIVATLG